MHHLRRIALTVEEPETGCFMWLLMESTGDAVVFDVQLAVSRVYSTYLEALVAGQHALLHLVPDLAAGPRRSGENENADPVTETGDIGERACA
jgi:hypothetical protein